MLNKSWPEASSIDINHTDIEKKTESDRWVTIEETFFFSLCVCVLPVEEKNK